MSKGTDFEIMKPETEHGSNGQSGRPSFNRDLAKRLILSKFSTKQICSRLKCSAKTVYRIRDELKASGELTEEQLEVIETPLTMAEFDDECKRATGFSFKDWMFSRTSNKKSMQYKLNFCSMVWEKVWNRPSLVLAKDPKNTLGDQLCINFLKEFGEDSYRLRNRKKNIRFLFRFLGRHDLCDRHLTMTNTRDPRQIKRVPQIEMSEFPILFAAAVDELPRDQRLAIMMKTATQMRTGEIKRERGFFSIRKGTASPSYLIMNSVEDFKLHVREKMNEEWDISHLPTEVKGWLYERYLKIAEGDHIFGDLSLEALRKAWKKASLKHIGVEFSLHDLRKVSITWFYACGVPLEIATSLNVGWKDLNTPKDHYLHLRKLLRKSQRSAYVDKIPAWFKDGLDEYKGD